MNSLLKFSLLGSIVVCLIFGCDQGLAPPEPSPHPQLECGQCGIAGSITFTNWPPESTVVDLRLVAFKNYPTGDIVSEVFEGKARYTSTLGPYGASMISYQLPLSPLSPGWFGYIAVAQRYGENLLTDWRVVGMYRNAADTTKPDSVFVPANEIVEGINIYVDFNNPLPLP